MIHVYEADCPRRKICEFEVSLKTPISIEYRKLDENPREKYLESARKSGIKVFIAEVDDDLHAEAKDIESFPEDDYYWFQRQTIEVLNVVCKHNASCNHSKDFNKITKELQELWEEYNRGPLKILDLNRFFNGK